MRYNIEIKTIESVKKFCDAASEVDTDIFVSQGRYTVDAKSVMGLFSLDLSKPVALTAYTDDEKEIAQIAEIVKKYNEA